MNRRQFVQSSVVSAVTASTISSAAPATAKTADEIFDDFLAKQSYKFNGLKLTSEKFYDQQGIFRKFFTCKPSEEKEELIRFKVSWNIGELSPGEIEDQSVLLLSEFLIDFLRRGMRFSVLEAKVSDESDNLKSHLMNLVNDANPEFVIINKSYRDTLDEFLEIINKLGVASISLTKEEFDQEIMYPVVAIGDFQGIPVYLNNVSFKKNHNILLGRKDCVEFHCQHPMMSTREENREKIEVPGKFVSKSPMTFWKVS